MNAYEFEFVEPGTEGFVPESHGLLNGRDFIYPLFKRIQDVEEWL